MKIPVIAVIGPTASGKSTLAVTLAQEFNGEVISADSRQVYRGLDLGTGKITKEESMGIRHHLIDVASPQEQFTVTEFIKLAEDAMADITVRGKIPIICGGSGQYIDALLRDTPVPDVPPQAAIRAELEPLAAEELFSMLEELDPERAQGIDPHNKRRLIRAIEIVRVTGKPVPALGKTDVKRPFDVLWIGIDVPADELRGRISERLQQRLNKGLVNEARIMNQRGVTWERMEELGLEYRYAARFLQGQLREEEFVQQLNDAIAQYARRQRTWWRKHDDINWVSDREEARRLMKRFLAMPH